MEDTLLPGDRILAQVFPVPHAERGKMILFISPAEPSYILVKRVIGVPGDHIRISRNVVILNGSALAEEYLKHEEEVDDFYPAEFPNDESLPGCAEGHEKLSQSVVDGEIVVPAGSYFVLGDWRSNSLDSRCWGFVSSSDLIGKPLMIYDSIDQTRKQESEPNRSWLGRRRWARLLKIL
jgi:signal peptidase I